MASETPDLNAFLGMKPRPWWRRRRWLFALVAVVIGGVLVSRCFAPAPPPNYITIPAARGSLAVTVSATGRLAPTRQVQVGSELSGLVEKVLVDVNDAVVIGQPLAIIDPSRLEDTITQSRATLAANEAAVAQNQATLDEALAQLRRMEEVSRLSGGKVPAKSELDAARAAVARARANLRSAQANVVSAKASLSSNQTQRFKSVIRSPENGVVLARQIDAGQTVAASFSAPTMFVIARDLKAMKLDVAIDEADVGSVRPGQSATFTVDAFPGRSFPARITRVDLGSNLTVAASGSNATSSTTQSQVVSYAASLSVANPDRILRPGMTATATIAVEKLENALLIPNGALRFTPGAKADHGGGMAMRFRPDGEKQEKTIGRGSRQTIYVLSQDGKPKPIAVITGPSDGTRTAVTSAQLKPGMPIIVGTGMTATAAAAAAAGN